MPIQISTLLPAYNAEATLPRAIASMVAQSHRDWELLVIDDGSTDHTARLAAAAAAADPRVRLVQIPHGRLVAALTAGLAAARGEFIARMDADDEALPERFVAQAALLESTPALGLAGSLVEFAGDRTTAAGYALHVDWINSLVSPADIALNRFIESPFAHPSVMFRRSLIAAHGGYRAGDFPEDYELWLRWLDAGVAMAKVPRVLLRWHDPPTRLSRTDARYSPDAFFRTKARWIAAELARMQGPRPVWIWGAGRPTRKRAAALAAHGVRIAGFIDIDPKKTGRVVSGVPVVSPDALPAPGQVVVLGYVASRGARDLIRAALHDRGYVEGADFLMCA